MPRLIQRTKCTHESSSAILMSASHAVACSYQRHRTDNGSLQKTRAKGICLAHVPRQSMCEWQCSTASLVFQYSLPLGQLVMTFEVPVFGRNWKCCSSARPTRSSEVSGLGESARLPRKSIGTATRLRDGFKAVPSIGFGLEISNSRVSPRRLSR